MESASLSSFLSAVAAVKASSPYRFWFKNSSNAYDNISYDYLSTLSEEYNQDTPKDFIMRNLKPPFYTECKSPLDDLGLTYRLFLVLTYDKYEPCYPESYNKLLLDLLDLQSGSTYFETVSQLNELDPSQKLSSIYTNQFKKISNAIDEIAQREIKQKEADEEAERQWTLKHMDPDPSGPQYVALDEKFPNWQSVAQGIDKKEYQIIGGREYRNGTYKELKEERDSLDQMLMGEDTLEIYRVNLNANELQLVSHNEYGFVTKDNSGESHYKLVSEVAKEFKLSLATNASMYLDSYYDYKPTSYAKNNKNIIHNYFAPTYNGVLVFSPKKRGLPYAQIVDRNSEGWKKVVESYNTAIANMRMISNGEVIPWSSGFMFPVTAAIDSKSKYLYILNSFKRMTPNELSTLALTLNLDIKDMVYLEGNSPGFVWTKAWGDSFRDVFAPQILGVKARKK